jgi:hypothetical protein
MEFQLNGVIASSGNQKRIACLFPKKTREAMNGIPKPFKVKNIYSEAKNFRKSTLKHSGLPQTRAK